MDGEDEKNGNASDSDFSATAGVLHVKGKAAMADARPLTAEAAAMLADDEFTGLVTCNAYYPLDLGFCLGQV